MVITPLTVIQRDDYSDIEKKQKNYSSIMTVLDNEFESDKIKNMNMNLKNKPSMQIQKLNINK